MDDDSLSDMPSHAPDGLDWSRGAARARPPETPRRSDEPAQPAPVGERGLGRASESRAQQDTGDAATPAAGAGTGPAVWKIVLATGLVSAVLAGSLSAVLVALLMDSDTADRTAPIADTRPSISIERTDAVEQVAEKTRAGVIKIESTRRGGSGAIEQDVGSGVVLDAEGHILTNAHVVLGTETLKAILPDGTERPAILVGHDFPFTDIAVLQVGPGNLTPVPLGDSSVLKLGQTIVAIGNPLAEFSGSVTVGVVSGLNRRRVFDTVVQDDLIQTDAAINNGNSGGALVNLEGELIGIPTAILRQARTGATVEGIAFALPSNRVKEIARGIIAAGGSYPRPAFGADTQDLAGEALARFVRLGVDHGALVTQVQQGSPAAMAGIAPGDVITRIGKEEVTSDWPFLNVLTAFKPGETVRVVLSRNGRIIEVDVKLGTRT